MNRPLFILLLLVSVGMIPVAFELRNLLFEPDMIAGSTIVRFSPFLLGHIMLLVVFYLRTKYLRMHPLFALTSLVGGVNLLFAIYLAWAGPRAESTDRVRSYPG